VRVEPLGDHNAAAWAALFESGGCNCYCRYWHFRGTRNEWLARSFHDPSKSRDEQLAAVSAGAPESGGLLALEGDEAIGWMKLVPRGAVTKLTSQGAYRPLALVADPGVLSIGCFFVHPAHRRKGVARALLFAAVQHARTMRDVHTLEAYPHHVLHHPVYDEEVFMGPEALFFECGFSRVLPAGEEGASAPYPVVQKRL
jgi:GNAT superfamily N-acetyltransferase